MREINLISAANVVAILVAGYFCYGIISKSEHKSLKRIGIEDSIVSLLIGENNSVSASDFHPKIVAIPYPQAQVSMNSYSRTEFSTGRGATYSSLKKSLNSWEGPWSFPDKIIQPWVNLGGNNGFWGSFSYHPQDTSTMYLYKKYRWDGSVIKYNDFNVWGGGPATLSTNKTFHPPLLPPEFDNVNHGWSHTYQTDLSILS